MDYTRLTIGQMAKLNNISTQTLRYYDQIGLLKPRFYDEDNKYRYYSIKQCAVLDAIIHMQSLKLSLSQIKDFLKPGKHQELYDAIVAERNVTPIGHPAFHTLRVDVLRTIRYTIKIRKKVKKKVDILALIL